MGISLNVIHVELHYGTKVSTERSLFLDTGEVFMHEIVHHVKLTGVLSLLLACSDFLIPRPLRSFKRP